MNEIMVDLLGEDVATILHEFGIDTPTDLLAVGLEDLAHCTGQPYRTVAEWGSRASVWLMHET